MTLTTKYDNQKHANKFLKEVKKLIGRRS